MKLAHIAFGSLAAFALAPLAAAQTASQHIAPIRTQRCTEVHAIEPVLLYRVSGSTLLGAVHLQLIVMSDGLVSLSSIDAWTNPAGSTVLASLNSEEALALADELIDAGAMQMCDDPAIVYDAPLATLTMFAAGVPANTFSYFPVAQSRGFSTIEYVIQGFLQNRFAGAIGIPSAAPVPAAKPLGVSQGASMALTGALRRRGDRDQAAAASSVRKSLAPLPLFLIDHRFDRSVLRGGRLTDRHAHWDPTDPIRPTAGTFSGASVPARRP